MAKAFNVFPTRLLFHGSFKITSGELTTFTLLLASPCFKSKGFASGIVKSSVFGNTFDFFPLTLYRHSMKKMINKMFQVKQEDIAEDFILGQTRMCAP